MPRTALLLRALRTFAVAMRSSYDISEVCYRLSVSVTEVLNASGSGVAVVDSAGSLRFAAATSQPIVEMERAQEDVQQGPCVEAFRTQEPVAVSKIASRHEWPAYTEAANRLGLHAVVGYPLSYGTESVGALNVYDSAPREWTAEDLDVIAIFADMAIAYLARMSELDEARRLADQLQRALDSRVIIEQAKGIVANQHDATVDMAFEMIRAHSRNTGMRLTQVAHAVVNSGLQVAPAKPTESE